MKALHISRHYLGQEATFTPRIPVGQMAAEKDMAPRVCAAPTLEGCFDLVRICTDIFRYLGGSMFPKCTGIYFFVYELEGDFVASTAPDAEKTGEVNCFEPVKGRMVGQFWAPMKQIMREKGFEATEKATSEEAIEGYYEWQKSLVIEAEAYANSL